MYGNATPINEHRGRMLTRLRRAGLLATALTCLALVAAACSSSASSGTAARQAGGSAKHNVLAYSQCMRAHGITAFPDPNPQGGLSLNGGAGSSINPSSPQFKAANNACKPLMPPPPAVSPAQQAKIKAGNLKYAECMRAHGISDFPDPNSQGMLQIKAQPGSDLDPNNPRYQAANKACQHYQYAIPGSGPPSLSTSGSGGGS
jgi:hypothetical protein